MEKTTIKEDYSLLWVIRVLYKWRRSIMALVAVVAIVTAAYTWFLMPNYYKATAVVYAASPTLANPNPIGGGEKTYYVFGTGEDRDRLISISNSSAVKDYLITKHSLADHYDIDTSTSKGKAKLREKFDKLYEVIKTKEDALKISVEDTDPGLARDIVRDARHKVGEIAQSLVKDTQAKGVKTLQDAIISQTGKLEILADTLTKLKQRYGIFDSRSQSEGLAEMKSETDGNVAGLQAMVTEMQRYALPADSINKTKAKLAAAQSKASSIEDQLRRFNDGVLIVRQLEVAQAKGVDELALTQQRLEKLLTTFEQEFTAMHVVEVEQVPDAKSRPRRSIIVLGLSFLTFVLACLYALLVESFRGFDWKHIYADPS